MLTVLEACKAVSLHLWQVPWFFGEIGAVFRHFPMRLQFSSKIFCYARLAFLTVSVEGLEIVLLCTNIK